MITAAREHVASLLGGLDVVVYAYPPASVALPMVAVVPGYPYVEGQFLDPAMDIGLLVQIVTGMHAGRQLDELIVQVAQKLAAAGYPPGQILPPTTDLETGVLTARIPVTLTWKE